MEFLNHYKQIKKDSKDMHEDLNLVWAEYEYVCSEIKTKIFEIINDNEEDYSNCDIDINDNIITINISPRITTSTLNRIEKYLGINGVICTTKKKNTSMKIIFGTISSDRE